MEILQSTIYGQNRNILWKNDASSLRFICCSFLWTLTVYANEQQFSAMPASSSYTTTTKYRFVSRPHHILHIELYSPPKIPISLILVVVTPPLVVQLFAPQNCECPFAHAHANDKCQEHIYRSKFIFAFHSPDHSLPVSTYFHTYLRLIVLIFDIVWRFDNFIVAVNPQGYVIVTSSHVYILSASAVERKSETM